MNPQTFSTNRTRPRRALLRRETGLAFIVALLAVTVFGCSGEQSAEPLAYKEDGSVVLRTRDLVHFGDELTQAVKINDFIYQARGTANVQMVRTSAGNVIIDTGLPTEAKRLKGFLDEIDDGPVTHIVVTHAHADHYGATSSFADEDTEIIAHEEFPENQHYLTELVPFFMPRNHIFFPNQVPSIPKFARGALKLVYPTIEPTILVHDTYSFESGGVRFEVIAMPGAEGSDGLCVWLPDHKILFTGDLYGHIFPMWPNLTTIRGERTRFPLPYVESLNRVLDLDPEIMIPSHFYPIREREKIRSGITRMRDAVLYVHDAVIDGMNDGKDVYTLMREIRLPEELAVPEVHGKVSWGVRSIWQTYSGWFHLRSTTDLYDVPASAVHPEIVALAGADTLTAKANEHVTAGELEKALHLIDMVLAAEPENTAALRVRLHALQLLLKRSGNVNHYEVFWLRHRIEQTEKRLGR